VEKIDQAIANVLRELREDKGLSQEQLSFDAELHRTYISQLERGLKSVTVKTLLRITDVLGVELHIFIKKVSDEYKKL
jgi:transcriptional regulator with XRE-family HTH domain